MANNFLGFSNSEIIKFALDKSCFEASSKSLVDKEKKATSAPESNADIKSKTKIPIKPKSKLVSKFWNTTMKLGGSGSKLKEIS